MQKLLIITGIFLLIFSSGVILKDWGNNDDVKLLSEDDFKENIVELEPPMDILQEKVMPYQLKDKLEYKEVGNGGSS